MKTLIATLSLALLLGATPLAAAATAEAAVLAETGFAKNRKAYSRGCGLSEG